MSINKSCFDDALSIALEILNKYDISDKDTRIFKIKALHDKILKENKTDSKFYSVLHEIKSYDFICSFGQAFLANDDKHQAGPDIKYKRNQIECVCCSYGEILKNEYKEYSINCNRKKFKIIDYNKTKEFLLPRITSSLYYKKDIKFDKYIKQNIIKNDECPIIFISLGELTTDFHFGNYGIDILEVLIGKGPFCYVFDRENSKIVDSFYQEIDTIKKNTGKKLGDISAKFFSNDNVDISGVIFSTAQIYEKYTIDNTFLFLNPYAHNPVDVNDFKNIIYWKYNNNQYISMKNDNTI